MTNKRLIRVISVLFLLALVFGQPSFQASAYSPAGPDLPTLVGSLKEPTLSFAAFPFPGWQRVVVDNKPSARVLQAMTYDSARKKTVMFGGQSQTVDRLSDTWEYDGFTWVQKMPAHAPSGRVNIDQAMTFDSKRGVTVLFGGLTPTGYSNETWEWNGSDWTSISTTEKPGARDAHAMTFDSHRGVTVLFGGYSGGQNDETWEYNGVYWAKNAYLSTKPSARYHHSMAFDSKRNVIVLFGGSNGAIALNDTWEYSGGNWVQRTTAHTPPARENHSIVYDSTRGVIVLFGGMAGSTNYNDTWEYDGTDWIQLPTPQAPSARNEFQLAFDSDRGKVVLFGGSPLSGGGFTFFNNETWEYPYDFATKYLNKKVWIIVYNPYVDAGKTIRLSDYYHWNSWQGITIQTIDFFLNKSGGNLRYSVAGTTVVDGFPAKTDGFTYDVATYQNEMLGQPSGHGNVSVDYNKIITDPTFDICGKVNNNSVNEVWIFNGPYYGFQSVMMAGPDSDLFNGVGSVPNTPTTITCNIALPILAPSMERGVPEALWNFSPLINAAMKLAYGGAVNQNSTSNYWEKFNLVASQSPNYGYSGCGTSYLPPNASNTNNWSSTATVQTYCDDFTNFPTLHNPTTVLKTVSCTAWGCSNLGYYGWWYGHFPTQAGCNTGDVASNWWWYFALPAIAPVPDVLCDYLMPYDVYLPVTIR